MNETELTAILEDAGLSPYQASAYVEILKLGSASATTIAKESDVPDPRIYDVLRDLEESGYIETYEQDSLRARAYSPTTILEDLRERATNFETAAEEIEGLWEAPTIETHTVNFVNRVDTVLDQAGAIIREATEQVQLAVNLDQYEQLRPALRAAHENDVHVRIGIYIDEDNGEQLPEEDELQTLASEVGYRTVPMPLVAIVDRTTTCFAPHELSTNRYGMIVEDRTHAYIFHWFFLAGLWESNLEQLVTGDDTPPMTYVNVRECIRDIATPLSDGATITATIDAVDVNNGASVSLEGTIVDVYYTGLEEYTADAPFLYHGGQATIVLDNGDRENTIGGWGAVIEDYEATRIVVESIEN
ncbi:TrmB family transcriptional regulator [Halorhabdus amylolytica]|uniref:TrmB family transcriptional regulator n=1 Tax=Halorhabdus amylolytica TaxID=2559573 RepID=UPI0010AA2FEC|nr:TrmB family transcriptional regulator [Halorhabdus amylolytica]